MINTAFGLDPRHVRRLQKELRLANLIDCGAHATRVNGKSKWDGTLWAVKVTASPDVRPRVTREAWTLHWRDFKHDLVHGNTIKALEQEMSGLYPSERKKCVQDALNTYAVNSKNCQISLPPNSADISSEEVDGAQVATGLQAVIDRLRGFTGVHVSKRAELVDHLALGLSRALNDLHSRRWYCQMIWEAWMGQVNGRETLRVLCSMLERLQADVREWENLKSPGALLTARWRQAAA